MATKRTTARAPAAKRTTKAPAEELPKPTAAELQNAIDAWLTSSHLSKIAYEDMMQRRVELADVLRRIGLNVSTF